MWRLFGELLLDKPIPNNCQDLQFFKYAWGGKGGSALPPKCGDYSGNY